VKNQEVNNKVTPTVDNGKDPQDEQQPKMTKEANDKEASQKPKVQSDRFAFGLARCVASSHVVAGHLYAKGAVPDFYVFSWGFTWVPWFFMLSGFILYSAEARRPNKESVIDYVLRRSVNIYPLYALGLIISFLLAKSQSHTPLNITLVLQAWLAFAWVPWLTEGALNMQCWFLCCLVFYWFLFRPFFAVIDNMKGREVGISMMILYFLPWLVVLIPSVSGQDLYWYNGHHFGNTENPVDNAVVFLKFHPFTFLHIFLLGMLLAKLRSLIKVEEKSNVIKYFIEAMAPLGYLGLALVFFFPTFRPPAAKLSARLSVLLPFQSMILLGLAGLPGYQPKVAQTVSELNFLEGYSYAVYVMQFIAYGLWPEKEVNWMFFVWLAAMATVFVHLVQKPADTFLRKTNKWYLLAMPVGVMILLPLLNHIMPRPELRTLLPPVNKVDDPVNPREIDLVLPIQLADGNNGARLINPSLVFGEKDEVIFAARRHLKIVERTTDNCTYNGTPATCLDQIWHSQIMLGRKNIHSAEWNRWIDLGNIPTYPQLEPWTGLRSFDPLGGNKSWTDLCIREIYNAANRTLIRLIVTGPEDPKIFRLGGETHGTVDLLFDSYPPLGRHGCAPGQNVQQMYLATGVNPSLPDKGIVGHHLRCGNEDRAEKNWIPFSKNGQLYFVYSILPHKVMKVERNGKCTGLVYSNYGPLTKLQAKFPGYFLSGSGQAIFVNDTDATPQLPSPHYLALFHVKDPRTHKYAHFAYRFNIDPPFQMLQVSQQLELQAARAEDGGAGFAFASGIGIRDRQVVITYSSGDYESRALVLTLWKFDDLFNPDHVKKEVKAQALADVKGKSMPPGDVLAPVVFGCSLLMVLINIPLIGFLLKSCGQGTATNRPAPEP